MALTDVAMVVFTAMAGVGSVGAVVVARKARDHAGTAVLTAKDANQIARTSNGLAEESNAIAKRAVEQARAVPTDVAWDGLLASVATVQTFDPASSQEQAGPLLTAMRIRGTLLIDRLDWEGFDTWVAAEVRFGVILMREAAERGAQSENLSVNEIVEIDRPFHTWVAGFTSNLRMFRKVGPDAQALVRLTKIAREHTTTVVDRNGWPQPVDVVAGVEPLR